MENKNTIRSAIFAILFLSLFLTVSIITSNVLFAQTPTPPSITTKNTNQGQVQSILPQQATLNTNKTQQTQAPITKPFTILKNNPIKNIGTTNSGIDGSSNNKGKQFNNEIVLLSQRYTSEKFGDKIVGEVLNNGGATARFVKITASFYDSNGIFLGSEDTYADPSTLEPGNKAPFNLFITSETIKGGAKNYEFTLQWRDINDDDKSVKGGPNSK